MLLSTAGMLCGPVDYGAEQGIQQKQHNKQIALAGIGGRIVETVFYGAKEVAEVGTSVEVIIAWISHNNILSG